MNAPGLAPESEVPMQARASHPPRVKVERGIYHRARAGGRRVYEICFQDSEGRVRWQTVRGGLREARQQRADVLSKLGRGERVGSARLTFDEVAEAWLAHKDALGRLRPRTRERYEQVLNHHLKPRIGSRRAGQLTADDVVALMAAMRNAGSAEATIRKAVTLLGTILAHAVRRGWVASNPVRELERDERPSVATREMRALARPEIHRLLCAAPLPYRPLLAAAVFTGLRFGELLGLTWAVDFEAQVVRVRMQIDRWKQGEAPRRVELKTPQAVRDVVLMPTLAALLCEHKERAFACGHARPEDLVFSSARGTPLHQRNVVRRGLDPAIAKGGLAGDGRPSLRFHDLRHTFASLLIAEGLNVVFVSRQLGHADPAITLRVYAHLFDQAEHAERARDALEAGFGKLVESSAGNSWVRDAAAVQATPEAVQGLRDRRGSVGTSAAR